MNLLAAARLLLARARGSFGLVLTHSLDAHNEMVVAARGQTMSIAAYPQLGLVLFAAEQDTTYALWELLPFTAIGLLCGVLGAMGGAGVSPLTMGDAYELPQTTKPAHSVQADVVVQPLPYAEVDPHA